MSAAATESVFRVKWHIPEDSLPAVATVLQNNGGPCPLLAVANALLLRRTIVLPPSTTTISEEHLLGCVFQAPSAMGFVDILPRLAKEVSVDLCFSGTTDFVPSPELSVFSGLGIRLVHGAIPDPHDDVIVECVSPFSYNEVCDQLVSAAQATGGGGEQSHRSATIPRISLVDAPSPVTESGIPASNSEMSDEDELLSSGKWIVPPHLLPLEAGKEKNARVEDRGKSVAGSSLFVENAPFIQAFLDEHRSMMTFNGLSLLHQTLEDDEISVLFYNNHFSVLRKNKGRLFTLVTDEGYLRAVSVMYEGLNDIDGNTSFYDAKFELMSLAGTSAARGVAPGRAPVRPPHPVNSQVRQNIPASGGSQRPGRNESQSPSDRQASGLRSRKPGKKTCAIQ
jgi:ubiquitin carboxyl-terminal hydrolase MINDY-1/2